MSPAPSRTFAYVACADSREILVLELNGASGELALTQRVPAGGLVMPLAVSPDRRYLYAGLRSAPYRVAAFAIDPASGQLSPRGHGALPDSTPYIATDRTGRHLLAASYGGHKVAVCRIDDGGTPADAHQVLDTEPNAHAIVPDPSNRFVFVPCLGAHAVMQFRFDEAGGTLTPNDPPRTTVRHGAGPRHFIFHPDGRTAYLLNELDATVCVFAFDADAGTLAPVQTAEAMPAGHPERPWAADLHLTPDARFLYASERRSSTLAAFAVDARGRLGPARHYATEREPRGFAIDPSGRYLLCVGQASHAMSVHAIDPADGSLVELRKYATGRNPNWVEIVSLP
ncbi:MAG: beta-propeller fold lactonase family protein [Burkholderiales bacterium]|nr:beta-propeller fold lactonase family protein [Burkholderiales bacterium]